MDLFFPQLGSCFQSSPGGCDDQLLSLGSLAQVTAQVTATRRILWSSILQQHDCLLKPTGVSCHRAHLSFCSEEADSLQTPWEMCRRPGEQALIQGCRPGRRLEMMEQEEKDAPDLTHVLPPPRRSQRPFLAEAEQAMAHLW